MKKSLLDAGFRQIGTTLTKNVTITVAGSAMFSLTSSITREANDCDLVEITPASQEDELIRVANNVGLPLGLPAGWLNSQMIAWQDDDEFPQGWESRTTLYAMFGKLEVKVISRCDAIALKAVTLKERGDLDKDLSDLEEIKPSNAEIDFATHYIDELQSQTDYEYAPLRVALMKMRK